METEVLQKAEFTRIRYGQCWEDADLLVQAAGITCDTTCLSICSAGDNTMALLACNPAKVIALDLNPAQLACLELRVAAYAELSHEELLGLIGATPCENRLNLYKRCRKHLSPQVREFWDRRPNEILSGIGSAGKFERYLWLFRKAVLPLIHNKGTVQELIEDKAQAQRQEFFNKRWNTWQWQQIFKLFFSRQVMGAMGRNPSFFQYVRLNVSSFLLDSTGYALTKLNPADNPYLHWILSGRYVNNVMPFSLRQENFEIIRANLPKLEWRLQSLEQFTQNCDPATIGMFNLSDVFEYVSQETYERLLIQLLACATKGARLVYWNMLAPRQRPEHLGQRLQSVEPLATELFLQNKTFFYSKFVVEEAVA